MKPDLNEDIKKQNSSIQSDVKIVKTDNGASNGQDKCPKCGATDIALNINTGKLRCNFCRYEFEPVKVEGFETDISDLEGSVIASGAQNIIADTNDIVTLKCSSCGAEVVIDTSEVTQARCHWCRNTLSINEQIPNGSIPDVVLPFAVKKEEAQSVIRAFVNKRKFYANTKFKQEFTTNNIMSVYFPYMIVDLNAHARLVGQGERLVRRYTRGDNEHRRTYYDADLYDVSREFDLTVEGLTVESNSDRLNKSDDDKTNNVINAIMPFDIENAVKWNANYLRGCTSERRDINIEDLKPLVNAQFKDISRFVANESLTEYDRGVAWSSETLDVLGEQWKSAYLPVWLYSYQEVRGNKKTLHYVAVNARTKEVMGSVPIHIPKLLAISALVELLGIILMLFVDFDYSYLFLSLGIIYYFIIYYKYRNKNARHRHELETKRTITNLRKKDSYVMRLKELSNSRMLGANNTSVRGVEFTGKVKSEKDKNN